MSVEHDHRTKRVCHLPIIQLNNWTVYCIQNPEGHRPKWKHKHINTSYYPNQTPVII